MRNRKKRILTAIVLVFCLLLTLPLAPAGVVQAVNLENDCFLTVKNPDQMEDLKNAKVLIDLYQVATAVPDGVYDTYGYEAAKDFAALAEDLSQAQSLDNEGWQKLAQKAAALVFEDTEREIAPAAGGIAAGEKSPGLPCGLYLVIARGEGLTDYARQNADGKWVTQAYSATQVYSYLPELVSLPSTARDLTGELDEEGNRQPVFTSDGAWEYDITAVLKPSWEPRFAPVEIVKRLLRYEDSQPASFVFRVDVYKSEQERELVDSDVLTFTFEGPGEKRLVLSDRIPVGTYVEVTEVYSGASYTPQGPVTQGTVVSLEGAEFSFVNDYDGAGNSGGAIVNRFTYENGGWSWEQKKDNLEE